MAFRHIPIGDFRGLRPLYRENGDWRWAAMAYNVETEGGQLRRGKGFSRVWEGLLTGQAPIYRLHLYPKSEGMGALALRSDGLFCYNGSLQRWDCLWALPMQETFSGSFAFLPVQLNGEDRLLIAAGGRQLRAFDPVTESLALFGSPEGLSDAGVGYLSFYFGRLFAAGEQAHPARLYYSQLPGDGRQIDNWGIAPGGGEVSGGFVEVGTDASPITGLMALSNQLLICKKDGLYRLLGDRPGNFRLQPIAGELPLFTSNACIAYGERVFFFTREGLYYYDGQCLRQSPGGRDLVPLLGQGALENVRCGALNQRLLFAFRRRGQGYNDTLALYDLKADRFLLKTGFLLGDMAVFENRLYHISDLGALCCWDGGDSYGGESIDAVWESPYWDFGSLLTGKRSCRLTLLGQGGGIEARVETRRESSGGTMGFGTEAACHSMELWGEDRQLRLCLRNRSGEDFTLYGGELLMEEHGM